jgi:hypothetical protein
MFSDLTWPWHPGYVTKALEPWYARGMPPAVVDSIRYPEQARLFREKWFVVVEVVTPPELREQRIAAQGGTLTPQQRSAPSEQPLPPELVTARFDGTLAPGVLRDQLVRFMRYGTRPEPEPASNEANRYP